MKAISLWLEPDPAIPQFKRLCWQFVDVSIADVLLEGIHPWLGPNACSTLLPAFLRHFNDTTSVLSGATSMGLSQDVELRTNSYYLPALDLTSVLELIQNNVHFTADLSCLELVGIAREQLRKRWSHRVALTLLKSSFASFNDLRQFLKAKDPGIKLSGKEDLDRYNLGELLSIEDFAEKDLVVLHEGLPRHNFRSENVLEEITDPKGRLKLVSSIRHFSLTTYFQKEDKSLRGSLDYNVERIGAEFRFRPDLQGCLDKRTAAVEFAMAWSNDTSWLVFSTTLELISEMVLNKVAIPSFPTLDYSANRKPPTSTAHLASSHIDCFVVEKHISDKANGETLKEILRTHGVAMTGGKDVLVGKLAALGARLYAEKKEEMDTFFANRRFIRVSQAPSQTKSLDLLGSVRHLRNLVLTMYVLKHLRGGMILESSHENATYTEEELAHALLTGKVELKGGFLQVA